jgi:hypothetical protein
VSAAKTYAVDPAWNLPGLADEAFRKLCDATVALADLCHEGMWDAKLAEELEQSIGTARRNLRCIIGVLKDAETATKDGAK